MGALGTALDYIERGWAAIPVPPGGKNPNRQGWQKLRINAADAPKYFNGAPQNVGVLLGEPSGNLVDVDLDCPEALELAPFFLPGTGCSFGREGKPRSHLLFTSAIPSTVQHSDPEAGDGMLVELRSTGGQTVFPGSTHASGEAIEWHEDGDPTPVDPTALAGAVRRLAAACLLRRAGFDLAEVLHYANGSETLSEAEWAERVGPKRARRLRDWLGAPGGLNTGHEAASGAAPLFSDASGWPEPRASKDDLEALATAIPNHDEPRNEYVAVGLGFYAASRGSAEGFAAWDRWAKKSTKYHGGTTGFWDGFHKSPPRITGIAPLIARARRADPGFRLPGWGPQLQLGSGAGAEAGEQTSGDCGSDAEPGERQGQNDRSVGQRNTSPLRFDLDDWDAREAFADEAPAQEWLVQHAIPRGVAGIVASAGDLGKSYIALELCLRVTRGRLLGGTSVESLILGGSVRSHGAAVLLTAEDARGSVHRRIRALDPDGQRQAQRSYPLYVVPLPDAGGPFAVVAEERGKVVVTPQFSALRERLRAIPDLALVVLDPLQCFAHADINADPQAAALTMSLLNMLAAETGATVLATHHVRKERDAPKNAQEARYLIRGSSALVDQSRVAVVLWAPDEGDARKTCKALEAEYLPNAVIHGAVVKSNDGADRSTWTLLRGSDGMLRDVTCNLAARGGSKEKNGAALIGVIALAAEEGRPFTKTGESGLYRRRAELGEVLCTLSRARLEGMAQELEEAKRIVTSIGPGSNVRKWLDIPAGPFAQGEGRFAHGSGSDRAEPADQGQEEPDEEEA